MAVNPLMPDWLTETPLVRPATGRGRCIYNTIVRVTPDGRRAVVADEQQHIVGATDCVIVHRPDGSATLYAVTDGGALASGDTQAAGTLVALTLPKSSSRTS